MHNSKPFSKLCRRFIYFGLSLALFSLISVSCGKTSSATSVSNPTETAAAAATAESIQSDLSSLEELMASLLVQIASSNVVTSSIASGMNSVISQRAANEALAQASASSYSSLRTAYDARYIARRRAEIQLAETVTQLNLIKLKMLGTYNVISGTSSSCTPCGSISDVRTTFGVTGSSYEDFLCICNEQTFHDNHQFVSDFVDRLAVLTNRDRMATSVQLNRTGALSIGHLESTPLGISVRDQDGDLIYDFEPTDTQTATPTTNRFTWTFDGDATCFPSAAVSCISVTYTDLSGNTVTAATKTALEAGFTTRVPTINVLPVETLSGQVDISASYDSPRWLSETAQASLTTNVFALTVSNYTLFYKRLRPEGTFANPLPSPLNIDINEEVDLVVRDPSGNDISGVTFTAVSNSRVLGTATHQSTPSLTTNHLRLTGRFSGQDFGAGTSVTSIFSLMLDGSVVFGPITVNTRTPSVPTLNVLELTRTGASVALTTCNTDEKCYTAPPAVGAVNLNGTIPLDYIFNTTNSNFFEFSIFDHSADPAVPFTFPSSNQATPNNRLTFAVHPRLTNTTVSTSTPILSDFFDFIDTGDLVTTFGNQASKLRFGFTSTNTTKINQLNTVIAALTENPGNYEDTAGNIYTTANNRILFPLTVTATHPSLNHADPDAFERHIDTINLAVPILPISVTQNTYTSQNTSANVIRITLDDAHLLMPATKLSLKMDISGSTVLTSSTVGATVTTTSTGDAGSISIQRLADEIWDLTFTGYDVSAQQTLTIYAVADLAKSDPITITVHPVPTYAFGSSDIIHVVPIFEQAVPTALNGALRTNYIGNYNESAVDFAYTGTDGSAPAIAICAENNQGTLPSTFTHDANCAGDPDIGGGDEDLDNISIVTATTSPTGGRFSYTSTGTAFNGAAYKDYQIQLRPQDTTSTAAPQTRLVRQYVAPTANLSLATGQNATDLFIPDDTAFTRTIEASVTNNFPFPIDVRILLFNVGTTVIVADNPCTTQTIPAATSTAGTFTPQVSSISCTFNPDDIGNYNGYVTAAINNLQGRIVIMPSYDGTNFHPIDTGNFTFGRISPKPTVALDVSHDQYGMGFTNSTINLLPTIGNCQSNDCTEFSLAYTFNSAPLTTTATAGIKFNTGIPATCLSPAVNGQLTCELDFTQSQLETTFATPFGEDPPSEVTGNITVNLMRGSSIIDSATVGINFLPAPYILAATCPSTSCTLAELEANTIDFGSVLDAYVNQTNGNEKKLIFRVRYPNMISNIAQGNYRTEHLGTQANIATKFSIPDPNDTTINPGGFTVVANPQQEHASLDSDYITSLNTLVEVNPTLANPASGATNTDFGDGGVSLAVNSIYTYQLDIGGGFLNGAPFNYVDAHGNAISGKSVYAEVIVTADNPNGSPTDLTHSFFLRVNNVAINSSFVLDPLASYSPTPNHILKVTDPAYSCLYAPSAAGNLDMGASTLTGFSVSPSPGTPSSCTLTMTETAAGQTPTAILKPSSADALRTIQVSTVAAPTATIRTCSTKLMGATCDTDSTSGTVHIYKNFSAYIDDSGSRSNTNNQFSLSNSITDQSDDTAEEGTLHANFSFTTGGSDINGNTINNAYLSTMGCKTRWEVTGTGAGAIGAVQEASVTWDASSIFPSAGAAPVDRVLQATLVCDSDGDGSIDDDVISANLTVRLHPEPQVPTTQFDAVFTNIPDGTGSIDTYVINSMTNPVDFTALPSITTNSVTLTENTDFFYCLRATNTGDTNTNTLVNNTLNNPTHTQFAVQTLTSTTNVNMTVKIAPKPNGTAIQTECAKYEAVAEANIGSNSKQLNLIKPSIVINDLDTGTAPTTLTACAGASPCSGNTLYLSQVGQTYNIDFTVTDTGGFTNAINGDGSDSGTTWVDAVVFSGGLGDPATGTELDLLASYTTDDLNLSALTATGDYTLEANGPGGGNWTPDLESFVFHVADEPTVTTHSVKVVSAGTTAVFISDTSATHAVADTHQSIDYQLHVAFDQTSSLPNQSYVQIDSIQDSLGSTITGSFTISNPTPGDPSTDVPTFILNPLSTLPVNQPVRIFYSNQIGVNGAPPAQITTGDIQIEILGPIVHDYATSTSNANGGAGPTASFTHTGGFSTGVTYFLNSRTTPTTVESVVAGTFAWTPDTGGIFTFGDASAEVSTAQVTTLTAGSYTISYDSTGTAIDAGVDRTAAANIGFTIVATPNTTIHDGTSSDPELPTSATSPPIYHVADLGTGTAETLGASANAIAITAALTIADNHRISWKLTNAAATAVISTGNENMATNEASISIDLTDTDFVGSADPADKYRLFVYAVSTAAGDGTAQQNVDCNADATYCTLLKEGYIQIQESDLEVTMIDYADPLYWITNGQLTQTIKFDASDDASIRFDIDGNVSTVFTAATLASTQTVNNLDTNYDISVSRTTGAASGKQRYIATIYGDPTSAVIAGAKVFKVRAIIGSAFDEASIDMRVADTAEHLIIIDNDGMLRISSDFTNIKIPADAGYKHIANRSTFTLIDIDTQTHEILSLSASSVARLPLYNYHIGGSSGNDLNPFTVTTNYGTADTVVQFATNNDTLYLSINPNHKSIARASDGTFTGTTTTLASRGNPDAETLFNSATEGLVGTDSPAMFPVPSGSNFRNDFNGYDLTTANANKNYAYVDTDTIYFIATKASSGTSTFSATENIDISTPATVTINSTLATNNIILLPEQTTVSENALYTVTGVNGSNNYALSMIAGSNVDGARIVEDSTSKVRCDDEFYAAHESLYILDLTGPTITQDTAFTCNATSYARFGAASNFTGRLSSDKFYFHSDDAATTRGIYQYDSTTGAFTRILTSVTSLDDATSVPRQILIRNLGSN